MFYVLCALTLLFASTSYGEGGNDCTSGFMSVDRMDDILGNDGLFAWFHDYTAIFPEVSFTSSGSIRSWIFGGLWVGNSGSFTELQIWRPVSGADGSYTKVGSTTIMTEQNSSQLYHYPLSSPLPFQAGDILGCSHPPELSSQLTLWYETDGRGHQLGYYYFRINSSQLNISGDQLVNDRLQLMVNVITDPPGCGRGFMSVERMRLILDIEMHRALVSAESRQQITPDMKFTCDGMITKWIIAAFPRSEENLHPELQVWRNISDTYQKINGTLIEPATLNSNSIYEYDSFSPIPIKSGDILGIFIPAANSSRLTLLSENTDSPTNYYLPTGTSSVSPHDTFDISFIPPVVEGEYWPMVTVEIVRDQSSPSRATISSKAHTVTGTSTSTSTVISVPALSDTGRMVQTTAVPDTTDTGRSVALYVGVGVSGLLVGLLVVAITVISVIIHLKRKAKKRLMVTADNLAYGVNHIRLSDNAAYSVTSSAKDIYSEDYEYVAPSEKRITIVTTPNEAYALTSN